MSFSSEQTKVYWDLPATLLAKSALQTSYKHLRGFGMSFTYSVFAMVIFSRWEVKATAFHLAAWMLQILTTGFIFLSWWNRNLKGRWFLGITLGTYILKVQPFAKFQSEQGFPRNWRRLCWLRSFNWFYTAQFFLPSGIILRTFQSQYRCLAIPIWWWIVRSWFWAPWWRSMY